MKNFPDSEMVLFGGNRFKVLFTMNGWATILHESIKTDDIRVALDLSKSVRTNKLEKARV